MKSAKECSKETREAPHVSEGNGQSVVPMLELAARQQGLKAHLLLREHPLLRQELAAQPELDVPRQACRNKACRERLLQRNKH